MPMVVGTALMVIALILVARSQQVQAQRAEAAGSGARYTVIETQGFNLLVTDNATNKLYYYATDKDVPVGSPMKLRASLNLTQVGKEEIKITTHNLETFARRRRSRPASGGAPTRVEPGAPAGGPSTRKELR